MNLYLAATFSQKDAAVQAIQQLKANGCSPKDVAVFSDEPVEFPRGVLDRPSHMSLAVVSGAATFFLLIVGLVRYTQYDYPLVTGGMPIFSFWPTGVVFYEITMLGAILTTFVCFLWESGLLRRDKTIPVPAVGPELICLRVCCPPDRSEWIASLLKDAGAQNVLTLEKLA